MSKVIPPTTFDHAPDSTLSVESKIFELKLKLVSTLEGGKLLGALKPIYIDKYLRK